MIEVRDGFLCHRALDACHVRHGFGLRGTPLPDGALRPVQVHGRQVARVGAAGRLEPEEADAVVSDGHAVAIVTADCVPILLAREGGGPVAAIHAGWRGLAAGVIEAGTRAWLELADDGRGRLCAVVGPHIGPCCYEVDAPVVDALERRFQDAVARALHGSRPGHHRLALAALVPVELAAIGLSEDRIHGMPGTCTRCDAGRFESYRRDGAAAGRMGHYIQPLP